MTNTDRAFIAALQQASAGVSTESPEWGRQGPHYEAAAPARGKAPLSEHLARRRAESTATPEPAARPEPAKAAAPIDGPLSPGLEVETLLWPDVAQQLAHAGRAPLLDLLSAVSDRNSANTPVIALASTRQGVGATTAVLALARIVGGVGGKTAILDTTNGHGAASQLGIRRAAQTALGRDAASIDNQIVSSRTDGVSVLALGAGTPADLIGFAVDRLAATHDLLLIDAGSAEEAAATLEAIAAAAPSVLLIDSSPSDSTAVDEATQRLATIGVTGLVETLAA